MRIGYARASTETALLDTQVNALTAAECEKIFVDADPEAKAERPGLAEALEFIQPGDCFVVWQMERLSRSLQQLVASLNLLRERKVDFISITENLDTSIDGGQIIYQVAEAFAEFQRSIIQENVKAGLTAARARGRLGGRPRRLDKTQLGIFQGLVSSEKSIPEICEALKISRSTYYRCLDGLAKNKFEIEACSNPPQAKTVTAFENQQLRCAV